MDKNLVDAIVTSLEGEATGWEFSTYTAENRFRQTKIWIANGRWGMDVKFGNAPKVGGVVMVALAPWRYRLWAAINAAVLRRQYAAYYAIWQAA